MPRWSLFLIFFLVALTIVGTVHYYLYRRIVVGPELPERWASIARVTLAVLAVSVPLSFFTSRLLGMHASRYVLFPIYAWMGVMMFLFFAFLGLDLLRLVTWLGARVSGHAELLESPERRLFLARVVACTAGGLVVPTAAVSFVKGMGAATVKPVEVKLRGLPRELDGFTIAQLTDLHLGPMRGAAWLGQVVAQTNALKADLVAITGDLVDGSVQQLTEHVAPLASLRATEGVFFVTGNHEYFHDLPGWMRHLPTLGPRVLRNERVTIRRGDAAFDLAGVDDQMGRGFSPEHGTDVARAMAGRDSERRVVLLAHQPKTVEDARAHGVDLVLSGHTHGGQLWPFSYLVRMTQPYLKGLHDHLGTQIYVSHGTGLWGPPMRLGSTAEITLVTLRAA